FDPGQLFQVGFQLSFTAIIGIVLFTPILNRMVFWPNRILRNIWSTLAASTGAQLGTLPLSLFHFGRFPVYFLLSGTVVIVSAFVAMLAGLLHGLVAGLFPESLLANLSGGLLSFIISLQNAFIFFFQGLPHALLRVQHFDAWSALLLALAIGSLAIWLRWRSRWALLSFGVTLLASLFWARAQVPTKGKEASLIVYHLSRKTLIDVVGGDQAITFGQEPSPDNLPWSAGPRREELGYRPAVTLPLAATADTLIDERTQLNYPLLSVGATYWFLLDGAEEELDFSTIKKATHLLVRNKYSLRDFPDLNPDHRPFLIVDGSNPYYLLDKWRQLAAERGLEIWITAEDGAYEIKY
ncbi:MAG: ComEC/Rec2 family competence protein, partial [Bacteroidota bacterium]